LVDHSLVRYRRRSKGSQGTAAVTVAIEKFNPNF
jgi:hypothetical protein